VRAPPHSLSGSLFGMSWTERDLKEKCVRAIHKRVRDVVALFFVANDNVLGNAWFPYIDTLALRPERRQTAALETLVMKSFERFNMERVVTDNIYSPSYGEYILFLTLGPPASPPPTPARYQLAALSVPTISRSRRPSSR
jgi:hypothetical protein